MASKPGTLYIGVTSTIFGRSTQHKEKLIKGLGPELISGVSVILSEAKDPYAVKRTMQ
jgi:hypothetical protein